MLAQKYRFHSRGGVNYVHQKGEHLRTANLSLTYLYNERHFRRFAVIVSKKVIKSAVGRNRIRRRVYEAIRLELPADFPTYDLIFTIHSPAFLTLPFSELRQTIRGLFSEVAKLG